MVTINENEFSDKSIQNVVDILKEIHKLPIKNTDALEYVTDVLNNCSNVLREYNLEFDSYSENNQTKCLDQILDMYNNMVNFKQDLEQDIKEGKI